MNKPNKNFLTEEKVKNLGFKSKKNSSYINGREWLLQVTSERVDTEAGEIINQEGTWFSAIGTQDFYETGNMVVCTLCRGNYVCRNVDTVEDVQLLYQAFTGNDLVYSENK